MPTSLPLHVGPGLLIPKACSSVSLCFNLFFSEVFHVRCRENLEKLRIHASDYLNIEENKKMAINAVPLESDPNSSWKAQELPDIL